MEFALIGSGDGGTVRQLSSKDKNADVDGLTRVDVYRPCEAER
jgi:hypothetical protein